MPLELVPATPEQTAAYQAAAGVTTAVERSASEIALFDADGRRVIRHPAGRLPEILDALGEALAASAVGVYVGAAGLVRIHPAAESKGSAIRRAQGALILHTVDGAHLVELAGRAARHEKWDSRAKDWVATDYPRRAADAYLSRGYWPELPSLIGFIEAPTITQDARIVDGPGYDAETGLFLAFQCAGYSAPRAKLTQADAATAADYLVGLFDSFPLVEQADITAAVAGILTALVRRLLPAAPMLAITAPAPGTGKTLLAETFAVVATGRRSSVLSLGHDEAEAEKRLGGTLLAGDAVILLDNIERPLGGDLLCQVTTQPSIRMRPLGVSTMVSVPTHALLAATGNNLAIVGDLKRRVVLIRLDAREERPELRQFDENHLDKVFRERGRIITAALTIIKAYLQARSPSVEGLAPYGSFEEWDGLVRRPLCWLGLADPLLASESLRSQDPDIESMRLLYSSWREVFSDHPVSVAEVVREGMAYGTSMSGEHDHAELHAALQLICSEKPNSRRAGFWLRAHRDRIVDGMRLEQVEIDRKGIAKWRITL